MKNRRSKTSWCHSRHSCCTGHSSAALDFSNPERAFEDFSLNAEHSELQVRQGLPASPSSFLGHQSSVDACTTYQLFYPLPVELHVSWAGFTAWNTLTYLFSVTYFPAQRKSKLIFMLILLLTTPVQNLTLTFPLPLLFCLPSLTGRSCSRGSVWFMAVWLCLAAVAALPHSVVFGLFGGVFKAFSFDLFSKDHGAEGHLLFTEALRILV